MSTLIWTAYGAVMVLQDPAGNNIHVLYCILLTIFNFLFVLLFLCLFSIFCRL